MEATECGDVDAVPRRSRALVADGEAPVAAGGLPVAVVWGWCHKLVMVIM
jgi:hypothetical protein